MRVNDLAGELTLVATALVVVLVSMWLPRKAQGIGALLALVGCGVSAASIALRLAGGPEGLTFDGSFSLDTATGCVELLIVAVTAVTVVLSPEWMRTDARHGEWYALVLLAAVGALAMAGATDLLELVLGVLLSSIAGYVLAGWHRRSGLSVEASATFFLVGAFTNALLLVGVTLIFGLAGSTRYQTIADRLTGDTSPVVLVAATVLLVIGLAFEIGAVPVHAWVPDVAQGAPAPASAFLTVAPKVGALVALARLVSLLPDEIAGWRAVVAVVAVATMSLGNLMALWQDDLRRLLGWSSVSQAGYALVAVVTIGLSPDAVSALVVFLVAYAAAQVAAFGVVTQLRGRTVLEDYRGLFTRRPWLAAILAVALLSFVGIPPLAGFAGKLLIFQTAIDGGYGWMAAVAVANTVLSLFYYARVLAPMAFDDDRAPVPLLGRWAGVGAGIAGSVVVLGGFLPEPLLHAVRSTHLLP